MKKEERRKAIVEILDKALWGAFKDGQRVSPFDADNSEFWAPHFALSVAPRLCKEIMALPIDVPSDEEIHFLGKERYNIDLFKNGEDKAKILKFAQIWRDGFHSAIAEIKERNEI